MITSYITTVEAEEYFAAVLDTAAWEDSTEELQEKALLAATLKVDLLSFIDEKADPEQEHEFPRTGETAVPDRVKWAVAEIALQLLDGNDGDANYSDNAVSSEGYSSVRAAYNNDFHEVHALLGLPSRKAYELLAPWLDVVKPGSINIIRK
jgi:hypothetical protein